MTPIDPNIYRNETKERSLRLTLRVPPTVNHYYGRNGGKGFYLTKKAKDYRHDVAVAVEQAKARGMFGNAKLGVTIKLHLPSGGDIDNRVKPLLDALQEAYVFDNDKQVDDLRVIRGHPVKGGRCEVTLWEL